MLGRVGTLRCIGKGVNTLRCVGKCGNTCVGKDGNTELEVCWEGWQH